MARERTMGQTIKRNQFRNGQVSQRLFEACTSERHQTDLTLPKPKADGTKSPSEFTRAMWRMEAAKNVSA